ncbi:DUF4166 domain-containing protein [Microbulbifer variabilis]|uniref:DUF4166 domain-containing protein n=1 Tax=Microbulbifer variabilis TaxID=266805 RepID=UPI001CFD571A|nr:DUF4166 domain-containing protein [Microbulbifer variabilis]
MKNAVLDWFGPDFGKLNPLLQKLHTQGARLNDEVDIHFGYGVVGWISRRMVRKLGAPTRAGKVPFSVEIHHSSKALIWSRTFAYTHTVTSEFHPVKTYRQGGYWVESTGPIKIQLGVSTEGGNWQWLQRSVSLFRLPIPTIFWPKVSAGKAVVNGLYQFEVKISLPVLGFIFGYSGTLNEDGEKVIG